MNTGHLRYEVRVNGLFVHVYGYADKDIAVAYAAQIGGVVVDLWVRA